MGTANKRQHLVFVGKFEPPLCVSSRAAASPSVTPRNRRRTWIEHHLERCSFFRRKPKGSFFGTVTRNVESGLEVSSSTRKPRVGRMLDAPRLGRGGHRVGAFVASLRRKLLSVASDVSITRMPRRRLASSRRTACRAVLAVNRRLDPRDVDSALWSESITSTWSRSAGSSRSSSTASSMVVRQSSSSSGRIVRSSGECGLRTLSTVAG